MSSLLVKGNIKDSLHSESSANEPLFMLGHSQRLPESVLQKV